MSLVAPTKEGRPRPLPFGALVEALDALAVPFERRGDELVMKDPRKSLTGELVAAVRSHKGALLALADLRTEAIRLQGYLIRLRCEDPPRGTRAQALAYQSQQIEKLAARSAAAGGTADGWEDAGDVMADGDQVRMLRQDLADLARRDAPYPVALPDGVSLLPASGDVFGAGRLFSGALRNEKARAAS